MGSSTRGHEVTLIAAADHATQANRFVRSFNEPPSTRLGEAMPEVVHAAKAERELAEWQPDIVHDHSLAGPLAAGSREAATIVTAHGPVEGEMGYYYRHLDPRVRLVAISDAQRNNAPDLQWVGRVYNAVPVDEYPFSDIKEDVAVFLGRMHPTKAPHIAIRAARAAGLPLILAGKCTEPLELDYFEKDVKPLLGPDVEWVGELETEPKKQCLQRARCLVFRFNGTNHLES